MCETTRKLLDLCICWWVIGRVRSEEEGQSLNYVLFFIYCVPGSMLLLGYKVVWDPVSALHSWILQFG